MTVYTPHKDIKVIDSNIRVFCDGVEIKRASNFLEGADGWVEYINVDDEGNWESDDKGVIIRRADGLVTWEACE